MTHLVHIPGVSCVTTWVTSNHADVWPDDGAPLPAAVCSAKYAVSQQQLRVVKVWGRHAGRTPRDSAQRPLVATLMLFLRLARVCGGQV